MTTPAVSLRAQLLAIYGESFAALRDLDAGDVVTATARRRRLVTQLEQLERHQERPMSAEPTAPEHIAQFFAYEHLPAALQEVSRPFGELAATLLATLPRNSSRRKTPPCAPAWRGSYGSAST